MAKAARLGQSVLQELSQPARYMLIAKTTIVATRLIHPRPVVLLYMFIKPVRILKFVEFPPEAHFLVT
jgi:hypothetical protein